MLHIDVDDQAGLSAKDFVGESVAVLGIKGSGKTNTVAVLIEELLPHLPLCVVDIEGEYFSLREKYDVLIVGKSEHVDVECGSQHAPALADFSLQEGISLVMDLSGFDEDEREAFVLAYFKALWETAGRLRKPYQVVIEEAHEFVPQTVRTPAKAILTRIALRGRKRGLGLFLVSQRSAKIEKDLSTQCGISLLHLVAHPKDLSVYAEIVPLPPREVEQMVREMQPGNCILVHRNTVKLIKIRQRYTFHVGATPDLAGIQMLEIRSVDSKLVDTLRKALGSTKQQKSANVGDSRRIIQLEKSLADAKATIQQQQKEIKQLAAQTILTNASVAAADAVPVQLRMDTMPMPSMSKAQSSKPNLSSQARERAAKRQKLRFDQLLERAAGCVRWQRAIIAHLHANPGKKFAAAKLATILGMSEQSILSNPTRLVKSGLVIREKKGREWFYSAVSLRDLFPDLDTKVLALALVKLGD